MRAITLIGRPASNAPIQDQLKWIMDALDKIATASRQEGSTIADPYTILPGAAVPLRILHGTPTLDQLNSQWTTFIMDMQNRGMNQKQATHHP